MKEIISLSLSETILLPAKGTFSEREELNYYYLGEIQGTNGMATTNLRVFIFNCNFAREIPELLKKELVSLSEKIESGKEVELSENNKKALEVILKNLSQSALVKNPPAELVDYLKKETFLEINERELTFLSGVSNIVEK